MSKVGKAPIVLESGVTVQIDGSTVTVKGPKGELTHTIPQGVTVEQQENELIVKRTRNSKTTRALHGLTRALLANMVAGVMSEYSKVLELVGTGYRARLQGNKLIMSLGFSHEVTYDIPEGLQVTLEGNNLINIKGIDKHLVGQAAANIRGFKKPEPYKGKGIKYQDEIIRRKAGKAAKTAAA